MKIHKTRLAIMIIIFIFIGVASYAVYDHIANQGLRYNNSMYFSTKNCQKIIDDEKLKEECLEHLLTTNNGE